MTEATVSKQTLMRLPVYLTYLKSLPRDGPPHVSSTTIAEDLGQSAIQVRKDLAAVCSGGKPKIGYVREELIDAIERFLGYHNVDSAILVGAGKLGKALLSYQGFAQYGLNIVAAFDTDERLIGQEVGGKPVFPLAKLPHLCDRLQAHIGIITVPAGQAQAVCDRLVSSGIRAIWNFAPVHLTVPPGILVQNENMAASLAVLSKHLANTINQNGTHTDFCE